MGREGGGRAGEKAEKEEGRHGGPGEGSELSRADQQVRHHSQIAGRPSAGVPQERPAARYLLPSVALARPAVAPRA